MHIGIVTTWFERGAAYVSRAYAETLSVRHRVFIYARGWERYARDDPRWNAENVTWGKQAPDKLVTYIDFADFIRWLNENRIDLVIFNEQHSWKIILQIRQKLNLPMVAYIDYYTPDTVPFFRLYDLLLCHTRRHYSVFKEHPQAAYIPWGTDVDLFTPERKRNGGGVTFFHSCGLTPLRKGTDILVRAFAGVKGNAKLVIHSQGPLRECPPTVSLIAQNPRIELIEKEVGAPGLYHRGDVYVYPSRLEGIGLSVPEALACGLPVITTDEAPMNEFVIHDVTGKLVAVKLRQRRKDNYYWPESICREDSLTEAMQFYVDNQRQLKEHQHAARSHAEGVLDWKKNARNLPTLMEDTVHKRAPADPSLMKAAARYERSRYGCSLLPERVSIALRKSGVGRFRRRLRSLLPSHPSGNQ